MTRFERLDLLWWAVVNASFALAVGSEYVRRALSPESTEEVRLLGNIVFKDGFLNSVCNDGKITCVEGLYLECSRGSLNSSDLETCHCMDGMVGGRDRTLPCVGKVGSGCETETGVVELRRECISNALCYDGLCRCAPGFSPSPSNSSCLMSISANSVSGHSCNRIDECDFYAGLGCVNGSCACDSTHQLWDFKVKKCLSKIGSVCDGESDVENVDAVKKSCVENGICSSNKICTCRRDFLATPSGECKVAYGMNCSIDGGESTCHPNFACLLHGPVHGLVCSCRPKEVYHDAYAHCDKLAEEDCSNNTPCVPNSVCFNERCVCLSGFEPNESGRCVADYGGDCLRNPNICSTRRRLICNAEKRQCSCPQHYDYDEALGVCIGRPGAACQNSTDCHSPSECIKEMCECKSGWTRHTPDGLCQLTWNEECSLSHPCNPFDFLRCDFSTQRCVCETEDMLYDKERKSCVAKAKTLCFIRSVQGRRLHCGRYAECVRQRTSHALPQDYGLCECTNQFQASENGYCDEQKSTATDTPPTPFKIMLCSVALFAASLFLR